MPTSNLADNLWTTVEGKLKIDHTGGVIYFHDLDGNLILRISQLDKPIPQVDKETFLDITHNYGTSWGSAH